VPLRYLIGPVTTERARRWEEARARGLCLPFNGSGSAGLAIAPPDSWAEVQARLPAGFQPDCVVIELNYTTVPGCLWQAPVPVVALAPDWQLQWHAARSFLPRAELVLTDTLGVEVMARQGIRHARQANLFGLMPDFLDPLTGPPPQRDVDLLFAGNLQPAVQRERLPWLARLARLSERWRVHIAQGVFGDDYRKLLLRSRVVFNRAVRGEWNLRVLEALCSGCLLLEEADNREVPLLLRDGVECAFYDEDNLEAVLQRYLSDEPARLAVAEAGRVRARDLTFAALWEAVAASIEAELPSLRQRVALRPAWTQEERLAARLWQDMGAADGGDPALDADLHAALAAAPSAALHNALGLAATRARLERGQATAEGARLALAHFQSALRLDGYHPVAALT
jgi:hypothetical protein